MRDARPAVADAALYAGSAVFALGAAVVASIPLYREWGRIAVGVYAAGGAAAVVIAKRRSSVRARATVALLVLAGAALLPLGLEATWRARTSPGSHIQAEAIVTEEGARALLDGRNPYEETYLEGPLASRPLGTKTHFPYLPAMLLFGLPRAALGDHPVTDARIWFAAATFLLAGSALATSRFIPAAKLRVAQVLLVLPTGALLMATGGDDLPVLALLLLAVVLAGGGRIGWAGLMLGLACATKQTAWILLPFLAVGVARANGRRHAGRLLKGAAAIALPIVGAFAAWNPRAFWEDIVLFPLGLGQQPTAAATPTIGSALIETFPDAKLALTVLLVAIVLCVAAYLLVSRPPASSAGAACRAGAVFAVGLALAPAARFGYIVYPIDLLVFGWLASHAVAAHAGDRLEQ